MCAEENEEGLKAIFYLPTIILLIVVLIILSSAVGAGRILKILWRKRKKKKRMIDLTQLEKKDVGRWVEYRGRGGEVERGRIKSWNDKFIFVVYKCDNQWHRFQDFTGAATNPEDLIFLRKVKIK